MLPSTIDRVPMHTDEHVNEQIYFRTMLRVRYYGEHPEEIGRRLRALDEEWDIERMLEANAATLAFTGTLASILFDRKWVVVPLVVSGFLLQHALQGWCPPVPALRRLGFRTSHEIDVERYALKCLRGDFKLGDDPDAEAALEAVRGNGIGGRAQTPMTMPAR